MNASRKILLAAIALGLGAGFAYAQPMRPNRGGVGGPPPSGFGGFISEDDNGPWVPTEGGGMINEDVVKSAREIASHSTGTPEWANPRGFEGDVFTFARIVFKSRISDSNGWGRGRRFGWWVDFPDADLNFSYRFQQLTTARVDPDGRVLKLTDPDLTNYPMIYMEHTGFMQLRENEVQKLRDYLLNGGALFVNDFWGSREWEGFESAMKNVLPGRTWSELTMDHPVFHCVFNIRGTMNSLQIPTMQFWNPYYNPNDPNSRLSQVFRGDGSENVHLRAWLDDKGRIMIIAIHNSDVSDGWEREGEDNAYFHTFSEKIAYPLGINIVFYLMTH